MCLNMFYPHEKITYFFFFFFLYVKKQRNIWIQILLFNMDIMSTISLIYWTFFRSLFSSLPEGGGGNSLARITKLSQMSFFNRNLFQQETRMVIRMICYLDMVLTMNLDRTPPSSLYVLLTI